MRFAYYYIYRYSALTESFFDFFLFTFGRRTVRIPFLNVTLGVLGVHFLWEDDGARKAAPIAFLIEIIFAFHALSSRSREPRMDDGILRHVDIDVFRLHARDRGFHHDVVRRLVDVHGELAFRFARSLVSFLRFRARGCVRARAVSALASAFASSTS